MANPEIERMAHEAIGDAAEQLRQRAHRLANAFTGDNARPCKRAAQAMYKAAALLDRCDEDWESDDES